MNVDKVKKLGLNLMRASGQNIQNDTILNKLFTLYTLTMFLLISILTILEQVYNFNINRMPRSIDTISACYLYMFTLIVYRVNLKEIKEILSMTDFWPVDSIDVNTTKKQIKIYDFIYRYIFVLVSIAILNMSTAYSYHFIMKRELTPQIYHLFDYENSPYFGVLCLIDLLSGLCTVFIVNGLDCIFFSLLSIVYCQMLMLKISLKNINIRGITNDTDEEDCYETLKTYIQHHLKILKFLKKIDDTFYLFLLNRPVITMFTCPTQLYVISIMTDDISTLIKTVTMILPYFCNIFIQCLAVTITTEQVHSLAYTAYECDWTSNPSSKIRRTLLMIMIRSQKIYKFSGGGFMDITMELFTKIVQGTFSFYTLLKSVQNK